MKIDQAFLDSLSFRGGWRLETIGDKTFYTIVNPIYCQIFWLQYWYQIGYKHFANQSFIVQLRDGNFTEKVVLDSSNGDLVMAPAGWEMISYLGNFDFSSNPPLQYNVNITFVFVIYLICVFVLLILKLTIRKF